MNKLLPFLILTMILFSLASYCQNPAPKEKKIKKKTTKNIHANFTKTKSVTLEGKNIESLTLKTPLLKALNINGKDYTLKTGCIDTFDDVFFLEFNVNGQLISNPPEQIAPDSKLAARVNLDENFWNGRANETVVSYIETLEALKNFSTNNPVITFGIGPKELDILKNELAYRIYNFVTGSSLPQNFKTYYENKLIDLGYASPSKPTTNYFPDLTELTKAFFTIRYEFYDKNGNRIDETGKLFCYPEPPPDTLSICCKAVDKSGGFYFSTPKTVPPNTTEVKYDLRLKSSLDEEILKCSANAFPPNFRTLLSDKTIEKIKEDIVKLKKAADFKNNPGNTLDAAQKAYQVAYTDITAFINSLNSNDLMLNGESNKRSKTDWIMHWLWLNKGIPKINPIASQSIPLFAAPKSAATEKVSAENKAKYEIFESLLNKNSFQIDGIPNMDELAKIKASLDKEAASKPTDGPFADTYLYSGLLKSSPDDGAVFMRHHDAQKDYIVMGLKPTREINEDQRMFVLVENNKPNFRLGIDITPEAITSDLSTVSIELLQSSQQADNGKTLISKNISKSALIDSISNLNKKIEALEALSKPPILPIILPEDDTPNFVTDVLEHDYFFDAPVVINYAIKSIDNTEKELKKSSYRINKLYRFRFKAGLVYSFLKVNDYTQVAPNQFTLSDPTYGVDGTFGIQVYPCHRKDIRKNPLWAPYVYAGLSMKKITENFYLGGGIEPVSGLAIGAVAHIGRREALIGDHGIPTGIKQTWGISGGFTILVDWVLFTKLFGFSTNKSLLGF